MRQGNYLSIMEAADRGAVFCPAISANFETLDTHKHDGLDSEKISAQNITKSEQILTEGSWVADPRGYKQTITLPTGYLYDTTEFKFVVNTGPLAGAQIRPTLVKINDTSCDVHVTFGNYDLKVVFS